MWILSPNNCCEICAIAQEFSYMITAPNILDPVSLRPLAQLELRLISLSTNFIGLIKTLTATASVVGANK